MTDYKHKYLKYKNKYLFLKGGLECHINPHTQHFGECWHDSIITQFIYGELIGERVQGIINERLKLNDYEDYINKLIEKAKNNLQIFLLVNFDLSNDFDVDILRKNLVYYLKNVSERFKKASILNPVERQQSRYTESKACIKSLFNLFNFNRIIKYKYHKGENKHGGTYFEEHYVTLILSFLFLDNHIVNFRIINYKNQDTFKNDKLNLIIQDNYNTIIDESIINNSISINFTVSTNIDDIDAVQHAVSLLNIDCGDGSGKNLYLFDDNNWNSVGTLYKNVLSIISKNFNNWKELIKTIYYNLLIYNFNIESEIDGVIITYSNFERLQSRQKTNIISAYLLELIHIQNYDNLYREFEFSNFIYYFMDMILTYNISSNNLLKYRDLIDIFIINSNHIISYTFNDSYFNYILANNLWYILSDAKIIDFKINVNDKDEETLLTYLIKYNEDDYLLYILNSSNVDNKIVSFRNKLKLLINIPNSDNKIPYQIYREKGSVNPAILEFLAIPLRIKWDRLKILEIPEIRE
jgi:hypothetical protein